MPIAIAQKNWNIILLWNCQIFLLLPVHRISPLPGVEWSGDRQIERQVARRSETGDGSPRWILGAVVTPAQHSPAPTLVTTTATQPDAGHSSDVICIEPERARSGFDALLIFCFIFQVNQKLYNALRGNRISTKLVLKSGFNEKSYKT